MDSGSQANLVSQKMLEQLNLSEKNIEKLDQNIIIEGSTGSSSTDAILGQITLQIYILLKRKAKNGDHIFGRTSIKALVTSMDLKTPIFGCPFLKSTRSKLHFGEGKTNLYSFLTCDNSKHKCSVALKEQNEKDLTITACERISPGTKNVAFYFTNFISKEKFSFKLEDSKNIQVPRLVHLNNF